MEQANIETPSPNHTQREMNLGRAHFCKLTCCMHSEDRPLVTIDNQANSLPTNSVAQFVKCSHGASQNRNPNFQIIDSTFRRWTCMLKNTYVLHAQRRKTISHQPITNGNTTCQTHVAGDKSKHAAGEQAKVEIPPSKSYTKHVSTWDMHAKRYSLAASTL